MNQLYKLTPKQIGEVLGLASEGPDGDETAIGSINVRLEHMFREVIVRISNVIFIQGPELDKLVKLGGLWRKGAKKLTTPVWEVERKDGLPDQLLAEINAGPMNLVNELGQLESGTMLCDSPEFYHKRKGRTHRMWMEMRAVLVPEKTTHGKT